MIINESKIRKIIRAILLKENRIRMKSKELPFLYEFALDRLKLPVSVKGDKSNA